ncbi:chemotaxis protein CheW [Roseomonas sp. WA12]
MALRFLPDPGILGAIDDDRAARLLDERAEVLARRGAPEPPVAPPVLVLAVGAETFGIPLDRVAEVLSAEPPCPLPGSPPTVLGLRARAGRLHAVLDLAALLGLPGGQAEAGHDILLRPLPGAPPGRRLALRVGRVLSAESPVPLPPDRAPASPGGAVAFHATLSAAEGQEAPILAVLDIDRLLRPLAVPTPLPDPGA